MMLIRAIMILTILYNKQIKEHYPWGVKAALVFPVTWALSAVLAVGRSLLRPDERGRLLVFRTPAEVTLFSSPPPAPPPLPSSLPPSLPSHAAIFGPTQQRTALLLLLLLLLLKLLHYHYFQHRS